MDDLVHTLRAVFPNPEATPKFMGGAVVMRAVSLLHDAKYRISGVTVLDVVEGAFVFFALFRAPPDPIHTVPALVLLDLFGDIFIKMIYLNY
ncbi:hypothetical protein B0H19DRAFT_1252423 [Mycena capillaripes]|nr:hypothetical protein B0H19DRAFT_1252423 [Mycena capillaripes]